MTSQGKRATTALDAYVTAIRLLLSPGLRRFVIAPVIASVLALAGIAGVTVAAFQQLTGWLQGYLPGWLAWLTWLLWPLLVITLLLVAAYGFAIVANFLAAPFNGLLAEQVEARLRGGSPPKSDWRQLLRDLPSILWNELRKLLYGLRFALPLLLLGLVPGINVLAAPVWLLLGSWLLALEYLDFPLGNHGKPFTEVRAWAAGNRWHSLALGGIALAGSALPLLNLLIMPATVAAATVLWVAHGKTAALDNEKPGTS